ncbi:MAG: DUF4127 family protein [Acidaminococcaceae bacterium]|jgi:hypothetical protein|nr:DUF4127 family protein [Acidaminococcaceae bacterium]
MKLLRKLVLTAACVLPLTAAAAAPVAAVSRAATPAPAAPTTTTDIAAKIAASTKGTLLFVPLDDRPVCKNYTVDTLRAAGWQVELPPDATISSGNHGGKPDEIFTWLEQKAPNAIGMVVSADALLYGGLVDSRTHHADPQVLQARAERLLNLKSSSGNPNVFAFVTVMRSPHASSAPVEPAYYKDWGPKIFRRGQLLDKADLGTLKSKERQELAALNKAIPAADLEDLDHRRAVNLDLTKALLRGVSQDKLDYLMVGRDDTSTFSQAHLDARHIEGLVNKLPDKKVRFFAGADQLGLILLNRAVNTLTYQTPFVYAFYAEGNGAKTIPSYEDTAMGETVKQHILAAGAYPVTTPKRADVCLGVFTPKDGKTLEAGNVKNNGKITAQEIKFTEKVQQLLRKEPVVVADVAFSNGSSTALTKQLFASGVAGKLAAYGGWNTASNAMGLALGQGLLAKYMSPADIQNQLEVRYLEDWGYQAKVRTAVYQELIWPKGLPGSQMPAAVKKEAEAAITADMLKLTAPVLGDMAEKYNYTLPWERMFEVYVSKK